MDCLDVPTLLFCVVVVSMPCSYLDVAPLFSATHSKSLFYSQFLGRKIYLDIQVKVDEEWRGKEQSLTKYGYIKK